MWLKWAAGCGTLVFAQRPSCSSKHRDVLSMPWDHGKHDWKWVSSGFSQRGSYQDGNFTSCGYGTDHACTAIVFVYMHIHVYRHVNAYIKYAYEQLINRSSNLTFGLVSRLVPSHCPKDWGLMGLPWGLWTHGHTYSRCGMSPPSVMPIRVQGVRKLPEGCPESWFPALLVPLSGLPADQWADVFIFNIIYILNNVFIFNKFPCQLSTEETKTVLCNLGIYIVSQTFCKQSENQSSGVMIINKFWLSEIK